MASITWRNAAGGDWLNDTNWSSGQVPGSADTAEITQGGTYTITNAIGSLAGIVLDDPAAVLQVQNLAIGNRLTLQAGTLEIVPAGTLSGSIVASGGSLTAIGGGTLDAVAWTGAFDLNDTQLVADGLTVETIGGAPGTIALNDATLDLTGSTGPLARIVTTGSADALALAGPLPAGTVLDAFAGTVLYASTAGSFDNTGTIEAAGAGASVALQAADVSNLGLLEVSDGASLQLTQSAYSTTPFSFENTGTIIVADGTLRLGAGYGTFTDTGSIQLDGASTLELDGTITAASLAAVDPGGADLAIGGLLDNRGNTLTLGSPTEFGTLSLLASAGTVLGGTLAIGGGTLLSAGGTLDGVMLSGPVVLGLTVLMCRSTSSMVFRFSRGVAARV